MVFILEYPKIGGFFTPYACSHHFPHYFFSGHENAIWTYFLLQSFLCIYKIFRCFWHRKTDIIRTFFMRKWIRYTNIFPIVYKPCFTYVIGQIVVVYKLGVYLPCFLRKFAYFLMIAQSFIKMVYPY